jgi:hypothetical protein
VSGRDGGHAREGASGPPRANAREGERTKPRGVECAGAENTRNEREQGTRKGSRERSDEVVRARRMKNNMDQYSYA